MFVSTAILVAVVGLAAGLLIGCIGIGGVILVPALTHVIGIPIQIAIAGAMMGYLFAGLAGTAAYARHKSIRWDMAAWLGAGAMPAALAGAWSIHLIDPLVLELAIGSLVLLSGLTALRPPLPAGAQSHSLSRRALAAIGAVTGYASAVTGTGGPLVLVPILTWLRVPVLTAIGLSQVIQLPIALLATGGNFAFGEPDLMLGLLLAAGLIVGTLAGAQFAHKMPRAVLGHAVSGALLIIGGLILLKAAQNPFS
jgi:uncharacterized membrane protein YfcA